MPREQSQESAPSVVKAPPSTPRSAAATRRAGSNSRNLGSPLLLPGFDRRSRFRRSPPPKTRPRGLMNRPGGRCCGPSAARPRGLAGRHPLCHCDLCLPRGVANRIAERFVAPAHHVAARAGALRVGRARIGAAAPAGPGRCDRPHDRNRQLHREPAGSGSQQAVLPGVLRQLHAAGDVELFVDVVHVHLHRALGDRQPVGDGAVAQPAGGQPDDLALPTAQQP